MSLLFGSFIFTWLFRAANKSILIVAIFHGMADIVFNTPSPGNLALVIGVLMTFWGIGCMFLIQKNVLPMEVT